jgi:hypothetical protein
MYIDLVRSYIYICICRIAKKPLDCSDIYEKSDMYVFRFFEKKNFEGYLNNREQIK